MTNQIGLKAGLEIHQQLNSKTKLFCRCPNVIRDDQADIIVRRKLRAAAGEMGEIDVAAMHEQRKAKTFEYHGYDSSTCAVELDEEPVHSLNEEALHTVLQTALLLNSKIADSILTMRKTVVDGSNTSGFQRTALVARGGSIPTLSGEVRISSICLEEDSCKIISRGEERDVYNLSRLGIPLIEIATEADIKSPEQLREAAEYLGMILRSTGGVKRGLGTIRQDVNVSIRGGSRVEIKGAQDLRSLQKIVEIEATRQQHLLEIARELQKRKARIVEKTTDITPLLEKSQSKLVQSAIKTGGVILATNLHGFHGLTGRETQPGRRFGTELSDYAKAYGRVSGIIHSDELPKYGIAESDVAAIRKKLGCKKDDAFAFVAAPKEQATTALIGALHRAQLALRGVPREVRKAHQDGTTSFLRPMPGAARMYPETDALGVTPNVKGIEKPRLITEKASEYQQRGITKDQAHTIVKEGLDGLFDQLVETNPKLNPSYIADTLLSIPRELQRRKLDPALVMDEHLQETLSAVNRGEVAKESVMDILAEVAEGKSFDLSKYKSLSDEEIIKVLKKVIAENKGKPEGALIGRAMAQLRGKAPGSKIVQLLKQLQK